MSAHYAEASKKILQYLAACSGHAGAVDVVKDRLLESTPVLEVCMYVCVCWSQHLCWRYVCTYVYAGVNTCVGGVYVRMCML